MSTVTTKHIGSCPAPVQEQDCLLVIFQHFSQGALERTTEHRPITRAQLLPHVDHADLWKVDGFCRAAGRAIPAHDPMSGSLFPDLLSMSEDPLRQRQTGERSLFGEERGHQVWCGSSQDTDGRC